mgnify:CR=1 FL=1
MNVGAGAAVDTGAVVVIRALGLRDTSSVSYEKLIQHTTLYKCLFLLNITTYKFLVSQFSFAVFLNAID